MQDHRYTLEPYKGMNTRHRCPGCYKNKTFAHYIDTKTSKPLSTRTGRCNRESECGYHYTPKQYFADSGVVPEQFSFIPKPKAEPLPPSYVDKDDFNKSMAGYENNKFVKFLHTVHDHIDAKAVDVAVNKYQIGTSMYRPGAVIFWQIDLNNNIRTGKIMLYNEVTGKRIKELRNCISWAHRASKLPTFNLKQCLFGLPLIKDNNKSIAIVESEKTAIIASLYLPQFVWLACGGIGQLNQEMCAPLKGRKVVLYPDLNAFNKWSIKAKEFGYNISDLLERKATPEERIKGLDIADYLIKMNLTEFKKGTLPTDIIELQKYYSGLEADNLIPEVYKNCVKNTFQGLVVAIKTGHFSSSLYIDALYKFKLKIEQHKR